jgi:sugar O-acyltransferase (sialic acid O-acetyltransferase NeuD family)
MARIVLHGAGPTAALARAYFDAAADHKVVALTAPGSSSSRDQRTGLPVVAAADIASRFPPGEHAMFVVPDPAAPVQARRDALQRATDQGYELVNYVDPSATIARTASLGRNCFILERVVVQPWVELADDVTLWSGSHVGHETVIEAHCFLAARTVVSGNVVMRSDCYLGPNASVRDAITLGEGTRVGAGVTLRKSTEPATAYVATPSSRSTLET